VTPTDWALPAVVLGTQRMLASRQQQIDGGDVPIGWKLGFGAPASLERFGLTAPLVGYLTRNRAHRPGATLSCAGWEGPVAEPEIAVHLGRDLDPEDDDVAGAIGGLAAAIELADVDPPPEDIVEVLSGNIFHRAVVLGDPDPSLEGRRGEGLEAIVTCDGLEVGRTVDVDALTGDLLENIRHTSRLLAAAGEHLRAGDVVIAGSIVPPLRIVPGQEIGFELAPLKPISVRV
jgi:2-keto-4-pentenoate hydratase